MANDAEDRAAAEAAGVTAEQQAALTAYHSEEHWLLLHRPQLESMRLPKPLWPVVYHKLYTERYDALDSFAVARSDDDGDVGFHLLVEREEGVKAAADVWIFDHAWEAKEQDAVQSLIRTPGLVDRLWALMDMDRRRELEEDEEDERKAREAEEALRRDDRKEPDSAEAERALKAAEDEKQRERERRQGEEQGEEEWANDDAVALVRAQTSASHERAVQALTDCRGDVIDAINMATAQPSSTPSPPSSLPSSSASPPVSETFVDEAALSDDERRARQVWDALFRYRYAQSFYTTTAREDGRPLTAADIATTLYVEDEVGSAITAGPEPNARVSNLMCVTLNAAFSLLWLTAELECGDEVVRPLRPALKKTREWSRQ